MSELKILAKIVDQVILIENEYPKAGHDLRNIMNETFKLIDIIERQDLLLKEIEGVVEHV